jgi:hypothetical protein
MAMVALFHSSVSIYTYGLVYVGVVYIVLYIVLNSTYIVDTPAVHVDM